MSHFTYMKTHFQNIFYLEKALNRLNIAYKQQETVVSKNLVIPQSNGYDISFCWNEDKYELVFDKSFWEQPYPIDQFINNIAQQYAGEVVIGESQKIGFKPVEYQQNVDGSRTVVLERWN